MPDTHLSLRKIAHYPTFLSDGSASNGVLLDARPSELGRLRSLDRFTEEHRATLVDAVTDDLRNWNAPSSAIESAESLRSPNAYAVVTGQQAGIGTGPLYTVFKAVGAVLAARDLALAHPDRTFVPVFWIEADDHDFDEARRITILDRSGAPQTFLYDDGETRPRHVGDRKISAEGIETLTAALREHLQPTEFTDEAIAVLGRSYGRTDETLADGFARALYSILGETPLLILSSRNPRLKRLAADLFAAEAKAPERLFEAVTHCTTTLRSEGLPTPIDPKPGALFMTHDGERRSLDIDGDGYTIRGTGRRMSRDEVARMATDSAELFSPNVILRPLIQDAILPTAIYLGGPSEVAYLRQIEECYRAFGMEAPAIAPRPFVLLVEPKVARVVSAGPVTIEELLRPDFDPVDILIDEEVDRELESASERAAEEVRQGFAELESITKLIDPTLEKSLGAARANATKSIEDFEKRLRSALKKKQQTEIDRLTSVRGMLLPGGKLQERAINPIYYIDKYGLARFRAALETIDLHPGTMQIIDL